MGDGIADAALRARFDKNVQAFLKLAEAEKHYPCMSERGSSSSVSQLARAKTEWTPYRADVHHELRPSCRA